MNESLEATKRLKWGYAITREERINLCECIEQALKDKEKTDEALENIKELFDFDFALRFPTNQPMLRITNKRTNEYWELPVSKETQDLLKEVLL